MVCLDKLDPPGPWDHQDPLENVVHQETEALKVEEECPGHRAHLELPERVANPEAPVCLENLENLEDR